MKILGINYLSESSISYMIDGKLRFAISEERINRIKNWYGNPIKSIEHFINFYKIKIEDIDCISTHGVAINNIINTRKYIEKINKVKASSLNKKDKLFIIKQLNLRKTKEIQAIRRATKLINEIKKRYRKKVYIFDHHQSHAASAAFFSGWQKSLVLTADGWGDGFSSKLYEFKNGNFKLLRSSTLLDSLGYFYGSITKLLGFKPHRHEGKVLGLAAHGNPNLAYEDIAKMISFDTKKNNFTSHPENGLYLPLFNNSNLNKLSKKYSKNDIAAATQKRLEDVILDYISSLRQKNFKLCLAGGIFSNVKLNQKISELEKVNDVFIFPNMGDGGLCVGSSILCENKFKKIKSKKLNNYYLGFNYSEEYILDQIRKYKLKKIYRKNQTKIIAKKLNEGKIIGIFQGKCEFGPRSLGNRSIFVNTADKKINKILNNKLGRTEFMPFAPITLNTHCKKMYSNYKKGKYTSRFMTKTYDCTNYMKKISPAVIHIDGTARPQAIHKNQNKIIYDILNKYFKLSKIPNLINTSFNMHEEPIVCTPEDAIKSFLKSKIDYLYIENFLIEKP